MQNFIQKIKQLGFYKIGFFAIIFVIGILVIGSIILTSLNSARVQIGGGVLNSVGNAPSLAPTFRDTGGKTAVSEDQSTAQNVQAQEGQLTQRKIIKNGSLSLLVKKAEDASQNIQLLAINFGGFVSDMQIYDAASGSDIKSGYITIRVPADRFDETMASIKKLAVKVEKESANANDVTEQFVDLEARLKNMEAQEVQYLEIMKKAYKVEEILNVQQYLGGIRGQIEQIKGQIQFLSRQIDMSTISISLTSEAEVKIFGIYWRPLTIIKQSFHTMLEGFAGYADSMIAFLFFLPRLILWLITIAFFAFIAWKIFRWLKTRFFPPRPIV